MYAFYPLNIIKAAIAKPANILNAVTIITDALFDIKAFANENEHKNTPSNTKI